MEKQFQDLPAVLNDIPTQFPCSNNNDCRNLKQSICYQDWCRTCSNGKVYLNGRCEVIYTTSDNSGKQSNGVWIPIVLPTVLGFIGLILIILGVCQFFRIRRKLHFQNLQRQASLSQFWTEMPASVRATLQEPPSDDASYDFIVNQRAVASRLPLEIVDQPPSYEEIIKEENAEEDSNLPPNYWKAIRNIVNEVYGSKRSRHGSLRGSQSETSGKVDGNSEQASRIECASGETFTNSGPSMSAVEVHSERTSRKSVTGILPPADVYEPGEETSGNQNHPVDHNACCVSPQQTPEYNINQDAPSGEVPVATTSTQSVHRMKDNQHVIRRPKSAEIPRKQRYRHSDGNLDPSFRRGQHRNSDSAIVRKGSMKKKYSQDCYEDFKRNDQNAYHLFNQKNILPKSKETSHSWTNMALTANTPSISPLKPIIWNVQDTNFLENVANRRKQYHSKSMDNSCPSLMESHKRSLSSDSYKMNKGHYLKNLNHKYSEKYDNAIDVNNAPIIFHNEGACGSPFEVGLPKISKQKSKPDTSKQKHFSKIETFNNCIIQEHKSKCNQFENGLPLLQLTKQPHCRYLSESSLTKEDDSIHRRTLSEEIVPRKYSQSSCINESFLPRNHHRLTKAKSMENSLSENIGAGQLSKFDSYRKVNSLKKLPVDENWMFNSDLRKLPNEKTALKNYSWDVDSNDLEMTSCLGKGYYGEVWKAVLHSQIVAVKWLKVELPKFRATELLHHITEMKNSEHPNLVKLLGVSRDPVPQIIMEYLHLGSLWSYLSSHSQALTLGQLVKYGLDIAEGMQYLEKNNIFHRDLQARSVLMVTDSWVKISDYFLSQSFDRDPYLSLKADQPILLYWFAPECILEGKFSFQSDIWSFGVTLWEIFSYGNSPILCKKDDLIVRLWEGTRLACPPLCPPEIYNIILSCWSWDPPPRPLFSSLINSLQRFL